MKAGAGDDDGEQYSHRLQVFESCESLLTLVLVPGGVGGCCCPVGASSVPSCFQALSVIVSLGTSLVLNEVEVVANDVFPSDGTFQKLQIFALG